MLKTLAKNIKGYTLVSILTPVFIVLEVILEAYIVYIAKDLIKTNFCKDNNISLIRIPYWEFNNISNILDQNIGNK